MNLTQAQLDAARDPVESVQWTVAVRALQLGVNVILDFGFWSRDERDYFRDRAQAIGADTEIRFLELDLESLRQRLKARNAHLPPHTFRISDAQLDAWWEQFEPPNAAELEIRFVDR